MGTVFVSSPNLSAWSLLWGHSKDLRLCSFPLLDEGFLGSVRFSISGVLRAGDSDSLSPSHFAFCKPGYLAACLRRAWKCHRASAEMITFGKAVGDGGGLGLPDAGCAISAIIRRLLVSSLMADTASLCGQSWQLLLFLSSQIQNIAVTCNFTNRVFLRLDYQQSFLMCASLTPL